MKKLMTITATLFFVLFFSCNKSDLSTPKSVQFKLVPRNLNVLLFDEGHAADKADADPSHIHLFDMNYETDGSKALIKSNLAFGVAECQENEWIPDGSPTFERDEEVPWSYCINDGTQMTGFFLNYYVTNKLANHPNDLEVFKTWFEKVVVDWMNENSLAPKVKSEKPGVYWRKIIGSVE